MQPRLDGRLGDVSPSAAAVSAVDSPSTSRRINTTRRSSGSRVMPCSSCCRSSPRSTAWAASAVQSATSTPSSRSTQQLGIRSRADLHQRRVDGDAVQPGRRRGLAAEGRTSDRNACRKASCITSSASEGEPVTRRAIPKTRSPYSATSCSKATRSGVPSDERLMAVVPGYGADTPLNCHSLPFGAAISVTCLRITTASRHNDITSTCRSTTSASRRVSSIDFHDPVQLALSVAGLIADHGQSEHGRLPGVLLFHLGHRHVELPPKPLRQRANDLPLLLQGTAAGQVKGHHARSDLHVSLLCLLLASLPFQKIRSEVGCGSDSPAPETLASRVYAILTPAPASCPGRSEGVEGSRWASPSSKRLLGRTRGHGWVRLPCTSAFWSAYPQIRRRPTLASSAPHPPRRTTERAVFGRKRRPAHRLPSSRPDRQAAGYLTQTATVRSPELQPYSRAAVWLRFGD